ncbi:hypothetical protein MSAN_01999200 [Mycena sanguinolenta]|uniref:DUF6534 domain-containing protein n=1 Tax=Mycena sanguinolenta TaxID=230812 RepID=A0A8H6XLW1_9AGAR|nr:hypothetical protein MSAN_01999200 [Mycena sanguinolenta]
MSGAAEDELLVKFFLGPWLIGSCLELVMMGVLGCQFLNYWYSYPEDRRVLRIAVAVLCVLNVLKSAECFASLWIFLINHFGDIQYDLALSATGWWDTANPLLVAILDFYVQCYFCSRLWAVSRRWWVVAPIFALDVFALVSMVLGTYYIETLQNEQVTDWFAAHLGSVFAGDVILSMTTAYFLIKTKKAVLSKHTARLIDSLIPLTFQTATPAAVVAMFNLIFSQMHRTNQPLLGYVEIAFNQVLPKVYAISMMYTLNARRELRARMSGSRTGNTSDMTSFRVAPRNTDGDVELGRIKVNATKEAARHVDVTDVFASTHPDGIKILVDEIITMHERAAANARVKPNDWTARTLAFIADYTYSKYVRGDNNPSYTKYLGYLDARELYPEFQPETFRAFVAELLAGKVEMPYSNERENFAKIIGK